MLAILGGAVGYGIGHRGADSPAVDPAVTDGPSSTLLSSVITLDVNPSIELDVDAGDTVTAVKALNSDARVVLGSMDLAGSKLDVAVNALIGSMLTNGYLDDLRNSILVSVTDGDTGRAAALQQSVAGMIESALGTGGLEGAVISQTVTPDAQLSSLAASYNITEGKAQLISKLVEADPTLTVESLAGLSVNDIALIASSRGVTDSGVTQSGTASAGAYIGADAALKAACEHAGLDVNSLSAKKIEFDSEHGRMVYEIDLYTTTAEYEYDIDALTGEVVKAERENYPTGSVPGTAAPAAAISARPPRSRPPSATPAYPTPSGPRPSSTAATAAISTSSSSSPTTPSSTTRLTPSAARSSRPSARASTAATAAARIPPAPSSARPRPSPPPSATPGSARPTPAASASSSTATTATPTTRSSSASAGPSTSTR